VVGRGVVLKLSQAPNPSWIALFRNLGGISYYAGSDFRAFPIGGSTIQVSGDEHYYQELINQVKKGIAQTNREYQQQVERSVRDRAAAEKKRLQEEAESERRRLTLSQRLTI
jgi:hypothetical protein